MIKSQIKKFKFYKKNHLKTACYKEKKFEALYSKKNAKIKKMVLKIFSNRLYSLLQINL